MNNKIEVFKNEQFGEVRTILEGETLLFCGSDIAKALGYARPGKAIIDHCKGVLKRDTLTSGGMQSLSYIPEGDVYRLIVHSKLPAAEKFEHWLFDEVVPTIRKTGGYMTDSLLEISVLRVCRVSLLLQTRFYSQKSKWHICCRKGSQS